jgi:ABC-type branched-subunit amino acid transport system ATPase component
MALLELLNVTKAFGGLNAVDDVSFSVERGELVGLIGANGAGKTTLFSVIAGNLKPTAGDIRLDGKSIANLPPFRGVAARHRKNLSDRPTLSRDDRRGKRGDCGAVWPGTAR